MPASLPVVLNDDGLHDVDAPPSFSTAGAFSVDLDNHGEAVHVHLHLDDDLSRAARLDASNNYVEAESPRSVEVSVRAVEEPVTGKLKIVTGYGAETEYVEITIEPPVQERESVEVDESLSRPSPSEPEPTPVDRLRTTLERVPIPVLALAAFAVLLALVVGAFAGSPAVLLAAGVVVAGVVAAIAFLLR